jgi:hypothetical protein
VILDRFQCPKGGYVTDHVTKFRRQTLRAQSYCVSGMRVAMCQSRVGERAEDAQISGIRATWQVMRSTLDLLAVDGYFVVETNAA